MPCTEKELARRRKRYALWVFLLLYHSSDINQNCNSNIGAEREQARICAQRRRQNISGVSLEVIRERKERNLEVQAAYRRGNRMLLKMKAWNYRYALAFQLQMNLNLI